MIASFRPIFVAFISVLVTVVAREIVFPAPSAHLFQPASLGDLDAYVNCFIDGPASEKYDIAILGAPFDTATTARPGARFGPRGIRQGSRRLSPSVGWSVYTGAWGPRPGESERTPSGMALC